VANELAGNLNIFPGNPFVPVSPTSQLPKQFYVQFPPWTTWRHRTGLRLGFSLFLPNNFPKG